MPNIKILSGLYKFKNTAYRKYINFYFFLYREILREEIQYILKFNDETIKNNPSIHEERALPGLHKYKNTGFYKYMISRYLYSIKKIKNKNVLDSGCGLGWGSYLISSYPKKLISIDIDEAAIEFAKKTWLSDKTNFISKSFLDLDMLQMKFDVILGMEVIEHLSSEDSKKYLKQCYRNLVNNGILILSSIFPRKASNQKINFKYHLKIYSKQELKEMCKQIGFSSMHFLGQYMAIIRK